MASIGDYLDTMVTTMTSPDQNIHARVSNYHDVEVWFSRGAFDRYRFDRHREDDLAHQLARLGSTTWIAYHRGRSEAYRRSQRLSSAEVADADRRLLEDRRRREYEEALDAVEGSGVSAGGTIRVRTRGLLQWHVEINPGAVRDLTEDRFLAEVHSAFRSLLNDREMKIAVLKSEHFDMGIPRRWLEIMKQLQAINARRQ